MAPLSVRPFATFTIRISAAPPARCCERLAGAVHLDFGSDNAKAASLSMPSTTGQATQYVVSTSAFL